MSLRNPENDLGILDAIIDCAECRSLREIYSERLHDVIALRERQLKAVLGEEPDPQRFDIVIHEADAARENAKYAYLAHRTTHMEAGQKSMSKASVGSK